MVTIHDRLSAIYRQNFQDLNLIIAYLNPELTIKLFDIMEKSYEAGVAKENEYWKEYGHHS